MIGGELPVRRATPRLHVLAAVAGLALVAGLATRRVDLAVYATPFVLVLLVGRVLADAPDVAVATRLDTDRALEGDAVELVVTLRAERAVDRVDLALDLPEALVGPGTAARQAVGLPAGTPVEVRVALRAGRWGSYELGGMALRVHDRLSLQVREQLLAAGERLRVYPRPDQLRRLPVPSRTQLVAGDRLARRAAAPEGVELADLRLFAPGDRPRDINWRASARQRELWVTQRHPERSTDVVLFVDLFAEADLLPAVRVAATLAEAYLGARDRVGLVGFGGVIQWVRAGQGVRQLHRLLDTLLDARTFPSYAWKDVGIIPPHVLVPGALVLAISPLEDPRTAAGLIDLQARGFDVGVIELLLDDRLPPATSELDALTRRLWRTQRDHDQSRLRRFGIPVAPWRDGEPLHATMEALWDVWGGQSGRRPAGRGR